jgi:hypothetical protein
LFADRSSGLSSFQGEIPQRRQAVLRGGAASLRQLRPQPAERPTRLPYRRPTE